MIVEDVRIKEKNATVGHQHEESFIDYYDIQIHVFGNWWSLDKAPEKCMDLDKTLKFRDLILDIIKGRH